MQDELGLASAGSSLRLALAPRPQAAGPTSAVEVAPKARNTGKGKGLKERARSAFAGPSPEVIVDLARAFIMAHIGRNLDSARLAGATGVSESTLRRAVHAQTGQRLQQLVQNIRLDQAHAWLSTNREARSQAQIAAALGFSSAAAFGRSYRIRFGETMTQTRKRAVQAAVAMECRQSNRLGRES